VTHSSGDKDGYPVTLTLMNKMTLTQTAHKTGNTHYHPCYKRLLHLAFLDSSLFEIKQLLVEETNNFITFTFDAY
jgi:hypothetical protein